MYRTNYGIGHSMKEILDSQQGDPILFPAPKGHQGLFEFMAESRHAQLAVNLAIPACAPAPTMNNPPIHM